MDKHFGLSAGFEIAATIIIYKALLSMAPWASDCLQYLL